MDYTISEVLGIKEKVYEGKDSVRFKVEGVEHTLSVLTFVPSDYEVGKAITGKITPRLKDGKTFYNFNPQGGSHSAPARSTPDINRLEMKIDALMAGLRTLGGEITGIKSVLGDILSKVDKVDPNSPPF